MSKYRILKTKSKWIAQGRWLNPFHLLSNIKFGEFLLSYICWTTIDVGQENKVRRFIDSLQEQERILLEDIKMCFSKEEIIETEYIEDTKKD